MELLLFGVWHRTLSSCTKREGCTALSISRYSVILMRQAEMEMKNIFDILHDLPRKARKVLQPSRKTAVTWQNLSRKRTTLANRAADMEATCPAPGSVRPDEAGIITASYSNTGTQTGAYTCCRRERNRLYQLDDFFFSFDLFLGLVLP